MNRFDDISKVHGWSKDELKQAVKYYTIQLNDPRSDESEMKWLRSAIQKCENLLNPPSEWEGLFA